MNLLEAPVSLGTNSDNYSPGTNCPNCPSVTVNGPEALKFPEDGLVTFRFKRGVIVARSASKREKASASVTLELTKLCEIEECEPEELSSDLSETSGNPIDDLFKQAVDEAPEEE